MRVYGRACVHDFLGSFIVYRNLVPIDRRLPGLSEVREELGIPLGVTPRKSSPEYARVVAQIIERAQELRGETEPIVRLLYIGDTHLNDGTAFVNLLASGNCSGAAFIGSETTEPEETHVEGGNGATILLSNRWSALDGFEGFCRAKGIRIDERTAVVIDLDKTALGARGRNDHVIDEARLQAIRVTIRESLEDSFDEESFQADYNRLNQSRYHTFTTDNQDYLAYICLMPQSVAIKSDSFFDALDGGKLQRFAQFISLVDEHEGDLSPTLRQVHHSVESALSQGNPTPFVNFRHNEYLITVEKMGSLPDTTPVERLLQEEIVITREVMQVAQRSRDSGALLFGLSDKPDEASFPTEELALQGYLPIHATMTHVIGG